MFHLVGVSRTVAPYLIGLDTILQLDHYQQDVHVPAFIRCSQLPSKHLGFVLSIYALHLYENLDMKLIL